MAGIWALTAFSCNQSYSVTSAECIAQNVNGNYPDRPFLTGCTLWQMDRISSFPMQFAQSTQTMDASFASLPMAMTRLCMHFLPFAHRKDSAYRAELQVSVFVCVVPGVIFVLIGLSFSGNGCVQNAPPLRDPTFYYLLTLASIKSRSTIY